MVQVSCRFLFCVDNDAGHRCPRHRHPCTEVVFILSGDGVLYQGGRRIPFHPGSITIAQPQDEHGVLQHQAGRHFCFGIVGGGAERLVPGVHAMRTPLEQVVSLAMREFLGYDPRRRAVGLGRRVARGEAQRSEAATDPARLDLLAGMVVSYLADSMPAQAADGRERPQRVGSHLHLSQADALLRAHLDRPLDAGTLADALFISPGYLRQIFHSAYGHGPMHRLLELRIDHAKKLLREDALPVGEVARRCGFASPFHFSRVFRRLAGMPPSAWSRTTVGGLAAEA